MSTLATFFMGVTAGFSVTCTILYFQRRVSEVNGIHIIAASLEGMRR